MKKIAILHESVMKETKRSAGGVCLACGELFDHDLKGGFCDDCIAFQLSILDKEKLKETERSEKEDIKDLSRRLYYKEPHELTTQQSKRLLQIYKMLHTGKSENVMKEASGAEWEKEVAKLSPAEKQKYAKAINTLMAWGFFEKEWKWTGMSALLHWLER